MLDLFCESLMNQTKDVDALLEALSKWISAINIPSLGGWLLLPRIG